MLETLRNITFDALAMRERARKHRPSSPLVTPVGYMDLGSDLFQLPPARSLTDDLVAIGIDRTTSEQLSRTYVESAAKLKANLEIQRVRVTLACRQLDSGFGSNAPPEMSLAHAYTESYTSMLQRWGEYTLNIFANHTKKGLYLSCRPGSEVKPRRTFSQDALDTLEHAFNQNAFPSREEKQELACRTSMMYRQVHVWFQNRRNRFRREDKELHVIENRSELPPELAQILDRILESDIAQDDASTSDLCKSAITESQAPAHAFPSAYPPVCDYDPFPIGVDERRFVTSWPRTATPLLRHSDPTDCPADIDGLVRSFAGLNIDAPSTSLTTSSRSGCASHNPRETSGCAANTRRRRPLRYRSRQGYQTMHYQDATCSAQPAPLQCHSRHHRSWDSSSRNKLTSSNVRRIDGLGHPEPYPHPESRPMLRARSRHERAHDTVLTVSPRSVSSSSTSSASSVSSLTPPSPSTTASSLISTPPFEAAALPSCFQVADGNALLVETPNVLKTPSCALFRG